MKWLLILLLPLVVSCGMNPLCGLKDKDTPYNNPPTDTVFNDYIQRFNTEKSLSTEISVTFEAMEYKYAGVCYSWDDGHREIKINKIHWDKYSDKQREQLIFHELGHCVLSREHNDATIVLNGTTCPESIMRSMTFSVFEIAYCYKYDYGHYLQEL